MPTIIKLQPAPRIDNITADGTALHQLPYPFHVYEDGRVGEQDLWNGDPSHVIGFQKDLARRMPDLWWADVVKDPQQAVGMYMVTTSTTGNTGVHLTSIASVTVFETEEEI